VEVDLEDQGVDFAVVVKVALDPTSALSQTIRMDGDKIVLQFPNNPVMDMLSIYELLTGVTLLKIPIFLKEHP
jgi:hypothetical protein